MQRPFRYLGVMIGDCMSRKHAWDDTIQKLHARLTNWKLKTFSIGGRLTLLKLILGASPLYNMSIYKVPKCVLNEMEAIRRKIFYGADSLERKITWVAWDKVLASKSNGGLGVSSFHALNRALLLKWVWHFISQDGSLWYRIIQALYGHHSALSAVGYSSLWSSILRELHVLKHKGFDFLSHCKKREGDGQSTRFCWTKDILVTLKLESTSLEASFQRPVRDGAERQQLIDLNLLTGSTLLSPSKDRWICDLSGGGKFRVKVARTKLDDVFLPYDLIATRWVKFIPIKVNVFAWRVRLDRLPTRVNLLRIGVGLESSLCPMCGLLPEDIHYVIFRCEIAQAIFRKIYRCLVASNGLPESECFRQKSLQDVL
ncbi:RNA-directed DNA polymerase, eukaryota [Tanacetum coccineum]